MPDASSSPSRRASRIAARPAPDSARPRDPVALERRQREAGARLGLGHEVVQVVDRAPVAILDDGHLDSLALGPADRVAGVLVEAGEERIVVLGELDDPRLRDLQRLVRVA